MKWLDDMNRAMGYIEDNLQEKVNYEKIAQIACCSVYHFQRMFTFMTGLTLSEYIRRRKMTMAAFDLQNSEIKVIDLALRYGYESPEAFARAFQGLHRITPTMARGKGHGVKAFPPVSFQITIRGVSEMNYKIVDKEAFQVYGIEEIFDTKDGENLVRIPEFWTEQRNSGGFDSLMRSAGFPSAINAVCGYRELEGTRFPYMLCVMKTSLSNTNGYQVVDIPKSTWAVFVTEPHSSEKMPEAVQDLNARIYTEWLPTAGYEMVEGCDFEMYYMDGKERFYEEIWIRVKPAV